MNVDRAPWSSDLLQAPQSARDGPPILGVIRNNWHTAYKMGQMPSEMKQHLTWFFFCKMFRVVKYIREYGFGQLVVGGNKQVSKSKCYKGQYNLFPAQPRTVAHLTTVACHLFPPCKSCHTIYSLKHVWIQIAWVKNLLPCGTLWHSTFLRQPAWRVLTAIFLSFKSSVAGYFGTVKRENAQRPSASLPRWPHQYVLYF